MLVAFLYLDKEIHPFATMERAMDKDFTLQNIQRTVEQALRILDFKFKI